MNDCDDLLATVLDNIPSFVLNSWSRGLAPAVYPLFQSIRKSSNWPAAGWKHYFVTALQKVESTSNVKNYQPISILRKVSLLFERLLFNFFILKSNARCPVNKLEQKLIYNFQSEFENLHSEFQQWFSHFRTSYLLQEKLSFEVFSSQILSQITEGMTCRAKEPHYHV